MWTAHVTMAARALGHPQREKPSWQLTSDLSTSACLSAAPTLISAHRHTGPGPVGHGLSFPPSSSLSFPEFSQLSPACARPHLGPSSLNFICVQCAPMWSSQTALCHRIWVDTREFPLASQFSNGSFHAASITSRMGMYTFL